MLRVICLIKDSSRLVGVRLFDELTHEINDVTIENAAVHLNRDCCSNMELVRGQLICLDGNIKSMPVYEVFNETYKNAEIAVMGILPNGYIVVNKEGYMHILSVEQAVNLVSNGSCYNAKIVKNSISAIKGNFKKFHFYNNKIIDDIENYFKMPVLKSSLKDKIFPEYKKKAPELILLGAVQFTEDTRLTVRGMGKGTLAGMFIPAGYVAEVRADMKNNSLEVYIPEYKIAHIKLVDVRDQVTKIAVKKAENESHSLTVHKINKSYDLAIQVADIYKDKFGNVVREV